MDYIKNTDTTDTNNITSNLEKNTGGKSCLKLNWLEQRVYTMAYKNFIRIDTEAKQLEDNISSLTNQLRLVSSEAELESIQAKVDESNIKLKNITEHPLHKLNRKQFLSELETSYNDYVKGIELVDKKDPYDNYFSLAEEGVNLSGIIEAVKQADKMHKQNNLESDEEENTLKIEQIALSFEPNTLMTKNTKRVSDDVKKAYNEIAFGNDKWIKAYGVEIKEEDIGKDLEALPNDILEILESACPTDSDKKVKDTHVLVWMPQTIIMDGEEQDLTLNTFGQLIRKKNFSENEKGYRYIHTDIEKQIGNKTLNKGQWVLMTKDVIDESRDEDYPTQQKLVSDLAEKSGMSYEVPTLLEATVCILAEYVSKGTYLFSDNPLTGTRCQEKLDGYSYWIAVGGFATNGLCLNLNNSKYDSVGIAARQKFF